MKFVDVKNDVAFRKIFGNEKKKIILTSFLNAVLDLKQSKRINEVILLNPYQLPRIIGEKSSIIDVKATDGDGSTFIIEMQVAEPEELDKRVLYYTSKEYAAQINSGDDYPKLRPVYFIGILNFSYFPNVNYFSTHLLTEQETGQCLLQDLQFRFIELTKFKKKSNELKTIIDKWTFFIKNAKNLDIIPENLDDEGLKEAYQAAAEYNWSKEEFDDYIKVGMREQDERGRITLAEKKSAENTRDEMIVSMFSQGIPMETISKISKLDEETIIKIIQSRKV